MRNALLALPLLLILAATPARAGDDDADTTMAKNRIAMFDQHGPKAKDPGKFADLVMELASLPHALTVERVGRIVLKDKNEEHQLIAAAALAEFRKPEAVRDAAGKTLLKAIDEGPSIDVVDTCVASIGKIGYREAVPVLVEILRKGGDPWLLVTAVRVCGDLKDMRALPQLLELWERFPVGDSWDGGAEVSVDTGTAGDGDQQAAEAAYNAQYGNKQRKGKPPMMLRAYIQELAKSARKITKSEDIHTPKELRAWMEARADEFKKLGIEIPKKRGTPPKEKDDKDGKGGKDKKDKDDKDEKGDDKKDDDKDDSGKK